MQKKAPSPTQSCSLFDVRCPLYLDQGGVVKPAVAVFSHDSPMYEGAFGGIVPVLPMPTSVPVPAGNRKSRATLWTLNNWTETELELAREYAQTTAKYMCWSQEVGEEGTPHLQGYVAWDNPRSLNQFRLDLGGRLHWGDKNGNTNGSAAHNRAYCLGQVEKKGFTDNPTFEEYGELPEQGARTDWRRAVNHLQTSVPVHTVVADQPHLLPCIRALERFQQVSHQPLNRPVNVIVLVGASGTGKSRWAYDNYPDLYSKPEGHWWDGYNGQKTVLLDDYYGDMPYSQLLKVCDRYPIQVPIKCGFVYAQWTTIIITSNRQPESWYFNEHNIAAFIRRISRIEREYNHADEKVLSQEAVCPPPPPPPPPCR